MTPGGAHQPERASLRQRSSTLGISSTKNSKNRAVSSSRRPARVLAPTTSTPSRLSLAHLLQLVWGAGVRDVPHCRAAPIAWAVLVATFLASEIGRLLDLPRWVRDLSPFTHVLNLPGGEVTAGPLVALPAVAAALITAGLWALNRRDLAVS